MPRAPRDQSVINGPIGDQLASLAARIVAGQRVGTVGLEPTTYGLKERPKPVGRVGDPLFRAWFVDAG